MIPTRGAVARWGAVALAGIVLLLLLAWMAMQIVGLSKGLAIEQAGGSAPPPGEIIKHPGSVERLSEPKQPRDGKDAKNIVGARIVNGRLYLIREDGVLLDAGPLPIASPIPGPSGKPGVDGSSPPCLAEPRQCRGEDGKPGEPGKNAEPAASYAIYFDGREYRCNRDAGSPDEAPTYTCRPVQPDPSMSPSPISPSPSPTPSPTEGRIVP